MSCRNCSKSWRTLASTTTVRLITLMGRTSRSTMMRRASTGTRPGLIQLQPTLSLRQEFSKIWKRQRSKLSSNKSSRTTTKRMINLKVTMRVNRKMNRIKRNNNYLLKTIQRIRLRKRANLSIYQS